MAMALGSTDELAQRIRPEGKFQPYVVKAAMLTKIAARGKLATCVCSED